MASPREPHKTRTPRVPSTWIFDKLVPIAIGVMVLVLVIVVVVALAGLVRAMG